MTTAWASAIASAIADRFGLPVKTVLHALLGWSAVWLPAAMAGASRSRIWSIAGALTLAGFHIVRARWSPASPFLPSLVPSTLILCVSASIDFFINPPDSILALCSVSAPWNGQFQLLMAHLRWFPVGTAAMFGLVLFEGAGRHGRTHPGRAAVAVGTMLALMLLAMEFLQMVSRSLHWPWTADALVYSMIFGMMLYHLLNCQPYSRKRTCSYREFSA